MKTLFFECDTGISGDMTLAALIDLGADVTTIRDAIDSLGLAGVSLSVETIVKAGFRATQVKVKHPEQHAHRGLRDITAIVDGAKRLTPRQKEIALEMFTAIAEAEAKVHGSTIERVHFHEVGAIDSIVDIVGVAVAFDLLDVDEVVCAPIPTGRGTVHIAHGQCPVPAPGTAELLKGMPLRDVPINAELTTPTGAAIVKVLADRFGSLPAMSIDRIGYGAGTMDLPGRANILRVFLGEAADDAETDTVVLLETNLDDATGEVIGYCLDQLLHAGALDAFTTPIQMKKNRPGVMVSVLAEPHQADALERILFQETGTFGIRRQLVSRSIRSRAELTVETPWGEVRGKVGWRGAGDVLFTPEYEDCARIAREHAVPLREVYQAALAGFIPEDIELEPPHEHDHHADVHDHDHDHDNHGHDHDHDHGHDHDHHHDH